MLQALCGWREFSNSGNTENNGRKEPLQIRVSTDGRDLLLLRTDAAEKTVESGSKATGSVPREKSRSQFGCCVFCWIAASLALKSSQQPAGGTGGEGRSLHGSTSLGLRCGLGVPW